MTQFLQYNFVVFLKMDRFCSILYFFTIIYLLKICATVKVKKSINEDTLDSNDDETLNIPADTENSSEESINRACSRRNDNSVVHEIRQAQFNEFPFIAAIYSPQDKYLCTGSIVAEGLIVTSVDCLETPPGYVIMNSNKNKENNTVALQVIKAENFTTSAAHNFKTVGLLYYKDNNTSTVSKIKLSNYTDYRNIVEFEAFGFGLNAEVGEVKQLQYVGLEHRMIYDKGEQINGFIDCIETEVLTCFKDIGGPAIFDQEMIGIVVKGQDECTKKMTASYAVNKYMVTVLPSYIFKAWLDEKIRKNKLKSKSSLSIYPVKPTSRRLTSKKSNRSHATKTILSPFALICSMFVVFVIFKI